MILLALAWLIRSSALKVKAPNRRMFLGSRSMGEDPERLMIMSMFQDVSAEELARVFHHYQHALTQDSEKQESEEACCSWDRASHQERRVMVAAARLALLELSTTPAPTESSRPYFAKPGEADWGC
jgi:hypothetical protein